MEMMRSFESIVDAVDSTNRRNIEGQIDLFSLDTVQKPEYSLPKMKEYEFKDMIGMEKEVTGLYLSGHPLDRFHNASNKFKTTPISEILHSSEEFDGFKDGDLVKIICIVQSKKLLTTRNKATMAFINAEDKSGSIEIVVFPKIYEQYNSLLSQDNILIISGKVSLKEEEPPKILCETIIDHSVLDKVTLDPKKHLFLRFPLYDEAKMNEVIQVLNQNIGDVPVTLYFEDNKKRLDLKNNGIIYSDSLFLQLKSIIGEKNIVYK